MRSLSKKPRSLLKKRGYAGVNPSLPLNKLTMKYSYSPKYPLEFSAKIYINKIIGQVFFGKPCKMVGIEIPIESGLDI